MFVETTTTNSTSSKWSVGLLLRAAAVPKAANTYDSAIIEIMVKNKKSKQNKNKQSRVES